jgi:PAS domain S-box-containing protein
MAKDNESEINDSKPLRVLMVEDSEDDALLIIRALKKGGYDPVHARVETAAAMSQSLQDKTWDIILSDYKMPNFSGPKAIALLIETNIDIPLIVVSGTIGEETATECMRLGAHDFFTKSNLTRLCAAVARELTEAQARSKGKQSENSLRESEQRFTDILLSSQDAILLIDGEKFVDCNEATARMLGYSNRNEVLNTHPSELSPPTQPDGRSSFEKADEMMGTALERGFHKFEWEHRKANGEDFPVEVSLTSIQLHGKNVLHCAWRDMSERKLVEGSLAKSEKLMKTITDSAQDAILMMDPSGCILFWNRAAERIFGYTNEEAIGQNLHQFLTPKRYLEAADSAFRIFKKTGQGNAVGKMVELHACRKNGEEIPIELSLSAILLENGWHAVGILHDITERKHKEEALQESENKYRFLTEKMVDMVWTVNMDMQTTYVSPSIFRILGITQEERMKQTLSEIMPQKSIERVAEKLKLEMEHDREAGVDPDRSATLELEFYHKDGSIVWFENVIGFIHDDQGNPIGIHGVSREITERKKAEEELQRQLKELQRWHAVTSDREGRVQELKKEVNDLLKKAGKPGKYAGDNE